jgi:hypothetical protein
MLRIGLPDGVSAAISSAASWLIGRAVSAPNAVAVVPAIFELRLKLLLLLMSLFPPQPQPQPQPPLQNAPILTPTAKEIANPAA